MPDKNSNRSEYGSRLYLWATIQLEYLETSFENPSALLS
jgi:hypothetical protein